MKGLCRAANSCKADLIVGALRVACNGLCTAVRFHSADENTGLPLGLRRRLACLRQYNHLPSSVPFVVSGLVPANVSLLRLSLMPCCSKLEFVALDFASLCRVFWMPSSQGSVNLRKTHQGHGLNVHELMYGVTRSGRSSSTSALSHEKRSGRQKKVHFGMKRICERRPTWMR